MGNSTYSLLTACENGNLSKVKTILEKNPKFLNKSLDTAKQTPLLIAVSNSRVEIVEYLLSLPDVDVNKQNKYGYTPLHLACYFGNEQILKLLLMHPEIEVTRISKKKVKAIDLCSFCENKDSLLSLFRECEPHFLSAANTEAIDQ